MAVISIMGTSGVGKSFLVKQLASLECLPGFFEGEEGVIPHDILASVFSKKEPMKRFTWFLDRYKKTLERARQVSDAGVDCYVDSAAVTPEAIMADEEDKYHDELLTAIEEVTALKSDKLVLLTATKEALRELITNRGRNTEQHEAAVNRALKIQEAFLRIAKREGGVIIIDRSKMNFADPDQLREVLRLIRE